VRELAAAAQRQSHDQAANSYARRFLRFNDQRRSFAGALPEDQYARVKGAVVARAGRFPKGTTTFEQRAADALVVMCGLGSAGTAGTGGSGGSIMGGASPKRTTVVVHADFTYLAGGPGQAELDVLGPLAPEVVRRLACDAKIILSADDEKGHSIQQGGVSRNPSPAQRIEIRRRDKGCRWPGCTYTEFTDVHHVVHWLNGGPTSIPNLVTLCDQHHRAVHEMGWKMSGDANDLLTFRSPTGRVTTSMPSPTFNAKRAGPPG
jgi:5-methylcytosine-specific restriction endonuclease McrA